MQNRDTLLADLKKSEQSAERLARGLSRAQANWQPGAGAAWSIWQCVDHLARINRVYSEPMLEAVSRAAKSAQGTGVANPGWFAKWFVAQTEPPVKMRMKAPAKAVPSADGDLAAAVAEFIASHAKVHTLLESWDRVDFNRVRFKNPFIPMLRFTIATGLLVIAAHDRRHLCQADHIKALDGFPPA